MPTELETKGQALRAILDRVTPTMTNSDRVNVRDSLQTFLNDLRFDPEYAEVRRLAEEAFQELGRDITDSVLAGIRGRSQALQAQLGVIAAVTKRAEEDARATRLELVRGLLTSANQVVESVRAAKASLDAGRPAEAVPKIESALGALTGMVDRLNHG